MSPIRALNFVDYWEDGEVHHFLLFILAMLVIGWIANQ